MLSWIKATVTPSIQTLILSCSTSFEAWKLLEKHLSPVSKTHMCTTRDQLHSLKKASDQSIANYLLHAKALADSLAAVGSPISDSDLIDCVTDGFGHTYKKFITSLHSRQLTSFDKFYDLAIPEEHLLQKMLSLTLSTGTTLVASHTSNSVLS